MLPGLGHGPSASKLMKGSYPAVKSHIIRSRKLNRSVPRVLQSRTPALKTIALLHRNERAESSTLVDYLSSQERIR
jgi:hypothetical protein